MTQVIFCNGAPIATQPTELAAHTFCKDRHAKYPRNEYWYESGQFTQAGFVPHGYQPPPPQEETIHG